MKKLIFNIIALSILTFSSSLAQGNEPKLVVGIVVDQMCYEYLYRYYDQFGKDGFKRLMNGGTNCRTTHYNYVPTYTGPGHASIYTGTTPANHGIIGNDWYNKKDVKESNCVYDPSATTIGSNSEAGNFSPVRLKVNTITDQLKLERSESKVISLSIKNRGAILPGGHLSDGTYWFDSSNGAMITSSFFAKQLPSWVIEFNQKQWPSLYLKNVWETLFPIESYTQSGPDDTPYEHLLPGKTSPTFPYDLPSMKGNTNENELFISTPFANSFLAKFAIEALKNEQLGQRNATDMLCISFSSTDIIGHSFGPQSIEIQDTYLRLDRDIALLLKELDKQVGKGKYTLFLTADHAVVPVPQLLIDKRLAGGYVFMKEALNKLSTDLAAKFGRKIPFEQSNQNIYLDEAFLEQHGINYEEVCQFIKAEVRKIVGVKQAYTASELQTASGDKWFEMVRAGYHVKESGDVLFILESGYLAKSKDSETARKGTSHGSPYAYDSHVPLLWYGKGIPKQNIYRTIEIVDIAPTLAHILNISFSHVTTGKPIEEVLK